VTSYSAAGVSALLQLHSGSVLGAGNVKHNAKSAKIVAILERDDALLHEVS
jgi:hypothetical protein